MPRPQFSLKAILVIVAVLSVPFAMFVSKGILHPIGGIILVPTIATCAGYLVRGWYGAIWGLVFSPVLGAILTAILMLFDLLRI